MVGAAAAEATPAPRNWTGRVDPAGSSAGRYTEADRRVEAPMTLVINLIYLAGIVLVPVGIAALFIRLSRRFMSS
jgi:hypothetical protein